MNRLGLARTDHRPWRLTVALLAAVLLAAPGAALAQDATSATPATGSPVADGQPAQLAEIPTAPGAEQPGADPDATLTLNLGEEVDSADPQVFAFLNEIEIGSKVFAPLLALTAENQVAAAAAEAMEVSADGTLYTFTIRDGMTYTDGEPVTAANYAYAIKRACDPEVAGNYSNILFDIVGCEDWRLADPAADADALPGLEAAVDEAITAPDERTLRIQLRQSAGYFPYVMSTWVTYPSRQDLVEAGGPDWWQDPRYYVGNGPFRLVSHTPGQEWVFERNDDYFRGRPGIANLVYREVSAAETALLAYQQGELDVVGPSATQLPQILADPTLSEQLYRQVGANTYYIAFNNDTPPFDDVRVRQAVSLALDRDEMISVLWEGTGFLNNALPAGQRSFYLDPRSAEMGPNAKYFKRDVAAAKKLLADAGFPDGLKVPMVSPLNAYGNTFNQSVELVIKQLKDAGIIADLRPQDYSAYISSTFLGKFDPGTMVWGLETPYQEPHDYLFNMYHPKGARNHAGVSDAKATEMIEKQAVTLDKAARKALIFDIQRYLGEQQFYVMGVAGNTVIATQPWVKNFFYETDYGRGGEYVPKLFLDGKK